MIPQYELDRVKGLKPTRGPSGKLWPVLSVDLYSMKFFYQIQIGLIYETMTLLELLNRFSLRHYNVMQMSPYDDCNVLGFRDEPPEEFVVELTLMFS